MALPLSGAATAPFLYLKGFGFGLTFKRSDTASSKPGGCRKTGSSRPFFLPLASSIIVIG